MEKRENEFALHVGNRLKFYRKIRNISLDQLADQIHKSKSTLSKYENGMIPIGTDVLYEIANVLGVNVKEFVDYPLQESKSRAFTYSNPFHGQESGCLYYYDGRINKTVQTKLTFKQEEAENNSIPCECYMDIPSMEEWDKCKYFYKGTLTYFDLFTYITLQNQLSPMEEIHMCILNAFQRSQNNWGFMMGVSYHPITPFIMKFLFSQNPLKKEELTKEKFSFTQDEIRNMKKSNIILLDAITL